MAPFTSAVLRPAPTTTATLSEYENSTTPLLADTPLHITPQLSPLQILFIVSASTLFMIFMASIAVWVYYRPKPRSTQDDSIPTKPIKAMLPSALSPSLSILFSPRLTRFLCKMLSRNVYTHSSPKSKPTASPVNTKFQSATVDLEANIIEGPPTEPEQPPNSTHPSLRGMLSNDMLSPIGLGIIEPPSVMVANDGCPDIPHFNNIPPRPLELHSPDLREVCDKRRAETDALVAQEEARLHALLAHIINAPYADPESSSASNDEDGISNSSASDCSPELPACESEPDRLDMFIAALARGEDGQTVLATIYADDEEGDMDDSLPMSYYATPRTPALTHSPALSDSEGSDTESEGTCVTPMTPAQGLAQGSQSLKANGPISVRPSPDLRFGYTYF